MNTLTKTLITTSFIAAPAFAADTPTTQPAAVPSTQPIIAQSNAPLVIPDGTSIQNPGPTSTPIKGTFLIQNAQGRFSEGRVVLGVRG